MERSGGTWREEEEDSLGWSDPEVSGEEEEEENEGSLHGWSAEEPQKMHFAWPGKSQD